MESCTCRFLVPEHDWTFQTSLPHNESFNKLFRYANTDFICTWDQTGSCEPLNWPKIKANSLVQRKLRQVLGLFHNQELSVTLPVTTNTVFRHSYYFYCSLWALGLPNCAYLRISTPEFGMW